MSGTPAEQNAAEEQAAAAGERPRRRAVFLDRDGTLIAEREYLADPAGVELLPGAASALTRLADAGYLLVLVTNQSGLARGYYQLDDFFAVQRRLTELLAARGAFLHGSYYCPHHPDFTGSCDCRKPATGLFRQAARELGVDFTGSVFVGDRLSDVYPARELGGSGILVKTGYGAAQAGSAPADVKVVSSLADAADLILRVGSFLDSPVERS